MRPKRELAYCTLVVELGCGTASDLASLMDLACDGELIVGEESPTEFGSSKIDAKNKRRVTTKLIEMM
jgi:hypothetical protein